MSATYETYSERGSNVAERLMATAKRNPEGALLIAAGACLMMRGMGRSGLWRSSPGSYKSSGGYPASTAGDIGHSEDYRKSGGMMDKAREGASELGGRLRQSAEEMAGYADHMRRAAADTSSHIGGRVRQSAEEMAGYADHMRRAAADTSSRIVGRATSSVQSGVGRMVEEQPLALALLGLAAGAAVAALVPPTRIEERTLGPIGERITEEAEEAGRRLKESATEAGKRLATDVLPEAARQVARSFTESDRDPKKQSGASDTRSASSRPASSGSMGSGGGTGSSAGSASAASTPSRSDEGGIGKSESGPASGTGSSGTGRVG